MTCPGCATSQPIRGFPCARRRSLDVLQGHKEWCNPCVFSAPTRKCRCRDTSHTHMHMRGNKCIYMHRGCREKPGVHVSASLRSTLTFGFLHIGRRSRCRRRRLWCRHVRESARIAEKSGWREGERREGRPARHGVMAPDTKMGPQLSPVSCSCWSHWCNCHHQPECSKSLKWWTVNNTKIFKLILLFWIWCSIACMVWCDIPVRIPVITSQWLSSRA